MASPWLLLAFVQKVRVANRQAACLPGSFLVFKAQRWARTPLRGQRLQPSKLARPGPRPQVPNDLGRTWLARCLQTLALASELGHRLVIEAIGSGSRCNELFVSPPSQFAASPPLCRFRPLSLVGSVGCCLDFQQRSFSTTPVLLRCHASLNAGIHYPAAHS